MYTSFKASFDNLNVIMEVLQNFDNKYGLHMSWSKSSIILPSSMDYNIKKAFSVSC